MRWFRMREAPFLPPRDPKEAEEEARLRIDRMIQEARLHEKRMREIVREILREEGLIKSKEVTPTE
jgi:hypothetical protein